jgi:ferrous iron transport protein A
MNRDLERSRVLWNCLANPRKDVIRAPNGRHITDLVVSQSEKRRIFEESDNCDVANSSQPAILFFRHCEIESHSTLANRQVVFDHGFSGSKSFSFVVPHVFMDGAAVNTLRLADLTPGKSAVVTAISGAGRVASRLMEMGFVPGTIVEVLRRAPFGGPVQYRVHGCSVSMRSAEASCVSVETDSLQNRTALRASSQLELAAG